MHKMASIPYWQDSERHEEIKILMGGDGSSYLREVKGFREDKRIYPYFSRASIFRLSSADAILKNQKRYPDLIFISIDPAAGGRRSRYAICSCFYEDRNLVVKS